VLKIIVAGPVKSGKTHLLLIIEKTLREVGVKNLAVKDQEEADGEWLKIRRAAAGVDLVTGESQLAHDVLMAIRNNLNTFLSEQTIELEAITTNKGLSSFTEEGHVTYASLKQVVNQMTPEQLAMPVILTGDGGPYVVDVWTAEQDQVNPSGDGMENAEDYRRHLIEEDGMPPEEADQIVQHEPVVARKGQVFLTTAE
jgi:hypothetical protein